MLKTNGKKILSLVLALAMICSLAVTTAFADSSTWEGSGTAADPYQIENQADLEAINSGLSTTNDYSGVYFKVMNDITLTSAWAGIGSPTITSDSTTSSPVVSGGTGFAGNLDGNGMTITVDRSGATSGFGGLINYLAPAGTLKNLTVAGKVENTGSVDAVGGVVGYNSGTIDKVTSNVAVTANSAFNVGGVAGFNNGCYGSTPKGLILNSENAGVISGNRKVGGITGENSGTIASCFNIANISTTYSGKNGIGGIAGRNGNNNASVETGVIRNCYNTGNINGGSGSWVGGICGFENSKSTCVNCYDTGSMSGHAYLDPTSGCTEGANTNCYYLDTVTGVEGYDKSIARTQAQMTATSFVEELEGTTEGIWAQNSGSYPYLTLTETADGSSSGGSSVTGTAFYVGGKDASDSNDGSADAPVATLGKAVSLAANSTSAGSKTIYVMGTVTIGNENIYGTTSNDQPNITVKAGTNVTGTNMLEVTGSSIITGLRVDGTGFTNTFEIANGGDLKIRNNSQVSGNIAYHVLSGGSLTLNRSTVTGKTYSVKVDEGAKLFEIGVASNQVFTMSGDVYLGTGTSITFSDPVPCAMTVQSAETKSGTLIATCPTHANAVAGAALITVNGSAGRVVGITSTNIII